MPTLRHIAREGRTYVIGVTSCISAADLPADLPGRDSLYGDGGDWLSRGNTVIVGPEGDVLAGPLTGEEGVLYAEIDTTRAPDQPPAVRSGRPLQPQRRLPPDRRHLTAPRGRRAQSLRSPWGRMADAPVERA